MPQPKPRKVLTPPTRRLRQVARAARIALAAWSATALVPAQAFCVLDGTTVTSSYTLNGYCPLEGSLGIASKATLINNGILENLGTIDVSGRLSGTGVFTNRGVLTIEAGGSAAIVQSGNLVGDTLAGGSWHLNGQGSKLNIGVGAILTNAANLWLTGNGSFGQLSGLQRNEGSLLVDGGGSRTFAKLLNTGTVAVAGGGSVAITSSQNLSKAGVLAGGRWEVYADGSGAGSLSVGTGLITTNAADILLSGGKSSFAQLSGLHSNTGSLSVQAGHQLTLANLENTGTLIAGAGGVLTIQASSNYSGKTLTGGRWQVEGDGALTVGTGSIVVNDAEIVLRGSGARMAQLSGLATNTGTLAIEGGNTFVVGKTSRSTPISVVNSKTGLIRIDSDSVLQVTGGGKLSNLARIENAGTLLVDATFESGASAQFVNAGRLRVQDGGRATVTNAGTQLESGVLTGGSWEVVGASQAAILSVGSGDISGNRASILLSGSLASFTQIQNLRSNEGRLSVDGGFVFNASALSHNTGSIVVGAGGTVSLSKSLSVLTDGTLSEGDWQVISDDSKNAARLSIGSRAIVSNAASILLSGAASEFNQINSLVANTGRLQVEGGRTLTLDRLANTGTVQVGQAGRLIMSRSDEAIVSGNLVGGTWIVDGGSVGAQLSIGTSAITTNSGTIILRGSAANFSNLVSGSKATLRTNAGFLTYEAGAGARLDNLRNTGTLTVGLGSSVNVVRSDSLVSGELREGTWMVQGSAGTPSSLIVGASTSAITSNSASVVLHGAGAQFGQLTGLATNAGSLSLLGGQVFTAGALVNTGTIVIDDASQLLTTKSQGFRQSKSGSLSVDGLLSMGKIDIQGGSVLGNGILRAPSITIGASANLAPGHSPGRLTLDGDVNFNGLLAIELASPTDYDVLDVTGALTFGDTSLVRLSFGFTPTLASYQFDFLHAGELVNAPQVEVIGLAAGYQGQMNCAANGCSFAVSQLVVPPPVPEPQTYALFLAGLAAITAAVSARRRRPSAQPAAA